METDEIVQLLDELGRRIGPYGEAAWGILVKQAVIEGLTSVIFSSIMLAVLVAIGIAGARWARQAWRREMAKPETGYSFNSPDPFEVIFPFGMGGMVWGVGTLFVVSVLQNGLLKLLNPEFEALRRLLEAIP